MDPSTQPSGQHRGSEKESREKLLTAAEIGMVNKRAQINSTITGLGTGVLAFILGQKMFRLSPNVAVMTAIASGSFIAYIESRTEAARGMAALTYSKEVRAGIRQPHPLQAEATSLDLRAAGEKDFDAGVGGLHEFVDRAATTRGDH